MHDKISDPAEGDNVLVNRNSEADLSTVVARDLTLEAVQCSAQNIFNIFAFSISDASNGGPLNAVHKYSRVTFLPSETQHLHWARLKVTKGWFP